MRFPRRCLEAGIGEEGGKVITQWPVRCGRLWQRDIGGFVFDGTIGQCGGSNTLLYSKDRLGCNRNHELARKKRK